MRNNLRKRNRKQQTKVKGRKSVWLKSKQYMGNRIVRA